MGVDLAVSLVYGVDVREPGAGGRSILDRAQTGEFGEFEPQEEEEEEEGQSLESALEELFSLNPRGWGVHAAVDAYTGECAGAVAGVQLAEAWNRGTPRNLGGGLTEAELGQAIQAAERTLKAAGIVRPRLWLVQAAS